MNRRFPILLALAGCSHNPSDQLSWRESWEIVAITDDGYFIDARMLLTNTGLLRGQGHLYVDFMHAGESPIPLHSKVAPSAITLRPQGDSLRMMGNSLDMKPGAWSMTIREGESALDATIHLTADRLARDPVSGELPTVPPEALVEGDRQLTVGVPIPLATLNGAWRSGDRGGLLQGAAMAIRRGGDILPRDENARFSFYVCDQSWSLGIEQVGQHALTWLATAEGVHIGHTLTIQHGATRTALNLEPDIEARIRFPARGAVWRYPLWDHLLPMERWLADMMWDAPTQQLQEVTAWVVVEGRVEQHVSGVVREASEAALDAFRRAEGQEAAGGQPTGGQEHDKKTRRKK